MYFRRVNDDSRVPTEQEKRGLYAEAGQRIAGLVAGEPDPIARMAGIVAVLHGLLPHFFWTGFYRVSGDCLVIGPYQGTPGCGRIGWGRGVCGTAWATGLTQVVADVHAFPGHIACDGRSASEIVVPVRDARGRVVAVFDVDALSPGAFDDVDREELERILELAILFEKAISTEEKTPPASGGSGTSYWANRKLLPEYEAMLKTGAFSGGTDSTQIISEERDAR